MRNALFQGAPQPLDVPGNLQRLRHQAQLAAERGAQLLVCPEMFLTGYNIGLAQVERLAEADDGPAAMDVVEIAQRTASRSSMATPSVVMMGRSTTVCS